MHLTLAPDIFLAKIEGDVVILDLPGDSYLCWLAEAKGTDALATVLIEAGLATGRPDEGLPNGGLTEEGLPGEGVPRRDWQDLPQVPPVVNLAAVCRFAYALCQAVWFSVGRPLGSVFRSLGSQHGVPAPALHDLAVQVATFDRLASWLPWAPECRFRSLLLRQYLVCDLDWVVGVRLYPFRAHCWLASEAIVLGDSVHRVSGYTPIMIFPGDDR